MNRLPCPATTASLILVTALGVASGCGGDENTKNDAAVADVAAATDVGQDGESDAAPADDGAADDGAADTGPAYDCGAGCAGFEVCKSLPNEVCLSLCDDAATASGAQTCIQTTSDCDAFATCMWPIAEERPPALRSFDAGPTGTGYRDLAGDFTVPTTAGDWHFADRFDGNDGMIFVFMGAGIYKLQGGGDYLEAIWKGASETDLAKMLSWSPPGTHYFFVGYRDANGADHSGAYVADIEQRLAKVLAAMPAKERAHWQQRLHFVTKRAPSGLEAPGPDTLGGWLGEYTRARTPASFGIDRFQRIRQTGLLSVVGSSAIMMEHLAFEARYYAFESGRAAKFGDEGVTFVPLIDQVSTGGQTIDVELPSKAEMAAFDTLEIDLSQYCKDHNDTNCFEWDYKADLRVAERPASEDNPDADTPCQIAVGAKAAKDETLGACSLAAGATEVVVCSANADCTAVGSESVCEGYQAAAEAVEAVAADTLACACITPLQEEVERARTCGVTVKAVAEVPGHCKAAAEVACSSDGDCSSGDVCEGFVAAVPAKTGYGGCGCKNGPRIQRWITSYHREGRWITDASPALYWLRNGGKVRFKYNGAYPYVASLRLRLRNLGKGAMRPVQEVELFGGGGFGKNYNDKYEPIAVEVPATAKKVELVVDVTGHGFGKDTANCAEFCNHTHHFSFASEGGGGQTFVRDQPYVGDFYGCAEQIAFGVVPNQYGTWTLGRGGWCPGYEVPLTIWDVSAEAKPGATVTVTYKGMLAGKPYDPVALDASTGGFGGQIDMRSWLLIYE